METQPTNREAVQVVEPVLVDFLERVRSCVQEVRRRHFVMSWLGSWGALGGLGLVLFLASVLRWFLVGAALPWLFLVGLWLLAWGGAGFFAWRQRLSAEEAAARLDRHAPCGDCVRTSWELSQRLDKGEELSPYFRVFLRRAAESAPAWQAREVVPGVSPLAPAVVLFFVAAFWALSLLPASFSQHALAQEELPESEVLHELLLPEDVQVLQEEAEQLRTRVQSEQGQEWAARYNELLAELSRGALQEKVAFERLAEWEAALQEAGQKNRLWQEGWAERSRAWNNSSQLREAARALQKEQVEDAAAALQALAERLQSSSTKLSEKELTELRESLQKSASARSSAESAPSPQEAEERAQLEEKRRRLLKKKEEAGNWSAEEQREWDQTERQLRRLNRKQQSETQGEVLPWTELDQKLAEAARTLQEERKKSGEFLQEAAQQMKQTAQRLLSEEEKQQLLERLLHLKEQLRQRREAGGEKQAARERFERRARGEREKSGQEAPSGKEPGENQPGGAGELSLGAAREQQVRQRGPAGASQEREAEEGSSSGKQPGSQTGPTLAGEATQQREFAGQDVSAVAQDTGEGASATETLRAVAEAGFTRGSYEKLYQQYETVAEEVIRGEKVPAGYKFYVERYFQLIRPRSIDKEKE